MPSPTKNSGANLGAVASAPKSTPATGAATSIPPSQQEFTIDTVALLPEDVRKTKMFDTVDTFLRKMFVVLSTKPTNPLLVKAAKKHKEFAASGLSPYDAALPLRLLKRGIEEIRRSSTTEAGLMVLQPLQLIVEELEITLAESYKAVGTRFGPVLPLAHEILTEKEAKSKRTVPQAVVGPTKRKPSANAAQNGKKLETEQTRLERRPVAKADKSMQDEVKKLKDVQSRMCCCLCLLVLWLMVSSVLLVMLMRAHNRFVEEKAAHPAPANFGWMWNVGNRGSWL